MLLLLLLLLLLLALNRDWRREKMLKMTTHMSTNIFMTLNHLMTHTTLNGTLTLLNLVAPLIWP